MLTTTHYTQVFVRSGLNMNPPTSYQLLQILKYQLGYKYDRKILRNPEGPKPYFVNEENTIQEIYIVNRQTGTQN